MKKQYFILAVAAIAVLSGCTKENDGATFTATIEQSDAKTVLNGNNNNVHWETGDQISVNGVTYTAAPDAANNAKATFSKAPGDQEDPALVNDLYKAYYPSTLYNGGTPTLPAMQIYEGGKISNLPMYAESDNHTLAFKNLCAVLAITVQQSQMTKVKSITVKANGKQLNGAFTVSDYSTTPTIDFSSSSTSDAADTMVTLFMETAVTIPTGGQTFYIAIPAGTYPSLSIEVFGKANDGTEKTIAKRMRSTSSVTVARSNIYGVTFSGTKVTSGIALVKSSSGRSSCTWVQLYNGGPLWAKFNVGATITDYASANGTTNATKYTTDNVGGLYCWGGTRNVNKREDLTAAVSGTDYYSGAHSGNLTSTEDMATQLWGSNWRLPTKSELTALQDGADNIGSTGTYNGTNHKWTGCTGSSSHQYVSGCTLPGYKVAGRASGYTSNNIFLPEAGYFSNTDHEVTELSHGDFWSSTPISSDNANAYFLYWRTDHQGVTDSYRYTGRSVRAVLAVD